MYDAIKVVSDGDEAVGLANEEYNLVAERVFSPDSLFEMDEYREPVELVLRAEVFVEVVGITLLTKKDEGPFKYVVPMWQVKVLEDKAGVTEQSPALFMMGTCYKYYDVAQANIPQPDRRRRHLIIDISHKYPGQVLEGCQMARAAGKNRFFLFETPSGVVPGLTYGKGSGDCEPFFSFEVK